MYRDLGRKVLHQAVCLLVRSDFGKYLGGSVSIEGGIFALGNVCQRAVNESSAIIFAPHKRRVWESWDMATADAKRSTKGSASTRS